MPSLNLTNLEWTISSWTTVSRRVANDRLSLQVEMWTSSTNLDFSQLFQWKTLRQVHQDLNALEIALLCGPKGRFNDDKPSSLWTDVKLYKLTEKLQTPFWVLTILESCLCLFLPTDMGLGAAVRSSKFKNRPHLKVRIYFCCIFL